MFGLHFFFSSEAWLIILFYYLIGYDFSKSDINLKKFWTLKARLKNTLWFQSLADEHGTFNLWKYGVNSAWSSKKNEFSGFSSAFGCKSRKKETSGARRGKSCALFQHDWWSWQKLWNILHEVYATYVVFSSG